MICSFSAAVNKQLTKRLVTKTIEQIIFDFLNKREEPQDLDVIFILGGSSLAPVERAAELWYEGWAPKIAFISTGGNFGGEKIWGKPENEKYREVLLERDIPEDAILTKGLTQNTLAEARAAIPFLLEKGVNVRRLILVSRPVHQLRAWATFAKQHPNLEFINCPATEDVPKGEDRQRLVDEVKRLKTYGDKGDILQIEIPAEVREATEQLEKELAASASS